MRFARKSDPTCREKSAEDKKVIPGRSRKEQAGPTSTKKPSWRKGRLREILIRPGTKEPFWEVEVHRTDGQIVRRLFTVLDCFAGAYVRRRSVSPSDYPF